VFAGLDPESSSYEQSEEELTHDSLSEEASGSVCRLLSAMKITMMFSSALRSYAQ
jgi:hypothetical protein